MIYLWSKFIIFFKLFKLWNKKYNQFFVILEVFVPMLFYFFNCSMAFLTMSNLSPPLALNSCSLISLFILKVFCERFDLSVSCPPYSKLRVDKRKLSSSTYDRPVSNTSGLTKRSDSLNVFKVSFCLDLSVNKLWWMGFWWFSL